MFGIQTEITKRKKKGLIVLFVKKGTKMMEKKKD